MALNCPLPRTLIFLIEYEVPIWEYEVFIYCVRKKYLFLRILNKILNYLPSMSLEIPLLLFNLHNVVLKWTFLYVSCHQKKESDCECLSKYSNSLAFGIWKLNIFHPFNNINSLPLIRHYFSYFVCFSSVFRIIWWGY